MADKFDSLLKERHAFYEVSRHYVLLDERPVGLPPKTHTVQAGFNVDVYGRRTDDNEPEMPPHEEYVVACDALKNLAERVSQHARNSCSLDVIPFPSLAIIDTRNHGQVKAMIRIQISHARGLDQPAGWAEQRALEEVETELKSLGIANR